MWIMSTHINFTSFHCTGRFELNKLTSLPMCGVIAHNAVGRASHQYRGGHGFESRWSPDFFPGFFFPIAQIGKFIAMITLHFHLQLQSKYELFHINFTSFHCTGRYELNKLTSLPLCGFIAHTAVGRALHWYRGGHGFESRWSPDFFFRLLSNCSNWKIYCDDHSSLSSTTAVQIWIISYKFHNIS